MSAEWPAKSKPWQLPPIVCQHATFGGKWSFSVLGYGSPWAHMLWSGVIRPVLQAATDAGSFGCDQFGGTIARARITDLVGYCQSAGDRCRDPDTIGA